MNQHWAYGLSCIPELFKSLLWSCAAREAGLRQFSPVSLSCVCTNFLARWLDPVALVVLFVAVLRLSALNCEVQFMCCFTDQGHRVKREIPAAMQRVKLVFIQGTGASLQRQLNMSLAINASAEVHLLMSELIPYQSHRFFLTRSWKDHEHHLILQRTGGYIGLQTNCFIRLNLNRKWTKETLLSTRGRKTVWKYLKRQWRLVDVL